jgi:hypothetical protein
MRGLKQSSPTSPVASALLGGSERGRPLRRLKYVHEPQPTEFSTPLMPRRAGRCARGVSPRTVRRRPRTAEQGPRLRGCDPEAGRLRTGTNAVGCAPTRSHPQWGPCSALRCARVFCADKFRRRRVDIGQRRIEAALGCTSLWLLSQVSFKAGKQEKVTSRRATPGQKARATSRRGDTLDLVSSPFFGVSAFTERRRALRLYRPADLFGFTRPVFRSS